jgi:glycosidase
LHNQWWNPEHTYTGYHGYWASDFEAVDAHYGTLEDWKALADALHGRGMRLIQDVVVNHTGDWAITTDSGRVVRDRPRADWLQPETGIYHQSGVIRDHRDSAHVITHELANLDDLRTELDSVRARLRAIYRWWIAEGGADGFRFDTHKYVERGFWPAFLEGEDGDLGVRRFAELEGRDFPTFGEVWVHSAPFGDEGEREMLNYLRRPGYEGVDAVLNFPLQESLLRVFGEGGSAAGFPPRP